MPTSYIFGMGERNSQDLRLKDGVYTLFARDQPERLEDGLGGNNVYSSHPMYLMKEKSGNFHVVFFKSSQAIDIEIKNQILTYKTV